MRSMPCVSSSMRKKLRPHRKPLAHLLHLALSFSVEPLSRAGAAARRNTVRRSMHCRACRLPCLAKAADTSMLTSGGFGRIVHSATAKQGCTPMATLLSPGRGASRPSSWTQKSAIERPSPCTQHLAGVSRFLLRPPLARTSLRQRVLARHHSQCPECNCERGLTTDG